MMDKEFLGAWDVPKDTTVTIVGTKQAKLEGNGTTIKAGKRPVLSFKNTEKKLIVNATIGKAIQGMYGADTDAWVGKKITLYATQCKAQAGGMVDCVRVRPMIPKGPATGVVSQPVDEEMRAKQIEAAEANLDGTYDVRNDAREPGED